MSRHSETPITGGCLCGAVRYEIHGEFLRAGHCHCSRCRRHSGAAMSTQGRVARESFRLLQGADAIAVWGRGQGAVKAFCRHCGSSLFGGDWPEGPEVSVRLGSVDGDPRIRPQYHTFVDSRAVWDRIDDDLPCYGGALTAESAPEAPHPAGTTQRGLRIPLQRSALAGAAPRAWAAFVGFLRDTPGGELSPGQRRAWYAYLYDAEVQRGGHRQFLDQRDAVHLDATEAALQQLGAVAQHAVLVQARRLRDAAAGAAAANLDGVDRAYHACEPELGELLERYLHRHLSEFFVLTGDAGDG